MPIYAINLRAISRYLRHELQNAFSLIVTIFVSELLVNMLNQTYQKKKFKFLAPVLRYSVFGWKLPKIGERTGQSFFSIISLIFNLSSQNFQGQILCAPSIHHKAKKVEKNFIGHFMDLETFNCPVRSKKLWKVFIYFSKIIT